MLTPRSERSSTWRVTQAPATVRLKLYQRPGLRRKHVSGQLVHEVSSLFACDGSLALHILFPHSQRLRGQTVGRQGVLTLSVLKLENVLSVATTTNKDTYCSESSEK